MKKILCVGTATVDIIAVIPDENIEQMKFSNASAAFLMLETGRKMEMENIGRFYGGGAINAAVAMKKIGHKVDCFVKIGNDQNGENIMKHLRKMKIGCENIAVCQKNQTAVSILVSAHEQNPTILTHRGANAQITKNETPWEKIKNYEAIYITNLSNQSAKIYTPIIENAHKNNVKVISNPGIRQITNMNEKFIEVLAKIDMFVVNRIEAEELLNLFIQKQLVKPKKINNKKPILKNGKLSVYVEEFLKVIENIGVELAVVTDGKNGAYLYHKSKFIYAKTKTVKTIGTVGAGDAFCSTLAALWLKGENINKAAKLATKNAMEVVKKLDAQSGLMSYSELNKK